MNFDFLWKWWDTIPPYTPDICKPKMHSGKCELCNNYGIIFLNGQCILCWDHYCEAVKKETD